MSTSAFMMFSPSSSKSTRSTPCVDGCCGPMLRTMVCSGPVAVCTVVMARVDLSPIAKSARALHGIVLAEGVAFPIVRQEHAFQIGVAFKANAHQVKYRAFMPVRGGPDGYDGLDDRISSRQAHAQANAVAPGNGQQMIIQLEARFDRKAV